MSGRWSGAVREPGACCRIAALGPCGEPEFDWEKWVAGGSQALPITEGVSGRKMVSIYH